MSAQRNVRKLRFLWSWEDWDHISTNLEMIRVIKCNLSDSLDMIDLWYSDIAHTKWHHKLIDTLESFVSLQKELEEIASNRFPKEYEEFNSENNSRNIN